MHADASATSIHDTTILLHTSVYALRASLLAYAPVVIRDNYLEQAYPWLRMSDRTVAKVVLTSSKWVST